MLSKAVILGLNGLVSRNEMKSAGIKIAASLTVAVVVAVAAAADGAACLAPA